MPIKPPMKELDFVRNVRNHREFSSKIKSLGSAEAAALIDSYAAYVGSRWARLGVSHLKEAQVALSSNLIRSVYSRSYYACYNLSKAIRFLDEGTVSLKGDDHQKAPDLPDGFPGRDKVSRGITKLYTCRLFADYDNWTGHNKRTYPLSPQEAVDFAVQFSKIVRRVLRQQYGIKI